MKTKKFKMSRRCYAKVLGKNRGLEVYYKGDVISRYPSMSRCGGLKATLELARKESYKIINHSEIINHSSR